MIGRLPALVILVVSLVLVPGPVFAYLTSLGGGSRAVATGTLLPLEIQPATVGSPSSSLQPGGTADLLLNVRNPNTTGATIISVAQGGPVTVVGGGAGCTSDTGFPGPLGTSGVAVTTTTGLSIPVAAGATIQVHLPTAATMSTASASGCQGASFRVPVTVVVQQ